MLYFFGLKMLYYRATQDQFIWKKVVPGRLVALLTEPPRYGGSPEFLNFCESCLAIVACVAFQSIMALEPISAQEFTLLCKQKT